MIPAGEIHQNQHEGCQSDEETDQSGGIASGNYHGDVISKLKTGFEKFEPGCDSFDGTCDDKRNPADCHHGSQYIICYPIGRVENPRDEPGKADQQGKEMANGADGFEDVRKSGVVIHSKLLMYILFLVL